MAYGYLSICISFDNPMPYLEHPDAQTDAPTSPPELPLRPPGGVPLAIDSEDVFPSVKERKRRERRQAISRTILIIGLAIAVVIVIVVLLATHTLPPF